MDAALTCYEQQIDNRTINFDTDFTVNLGIDYTKGNIKKSTNNNLKNKQVGFFPVRLEFYRI